MRYDVEVSGFPSSHAGHLCLLRLTEDDYPGTTLVDEWPSWTLPVLEWGKRQNGVVGYSHSGWGLGLPDYGPGGASLQTMPYRNPGRGYVGDGMSHLLDFNVGGVAVGEPGSDGMISHLDLQAPGKVQVTMDAAAMLQPKPTSETERIRNSRLDAKPYWHIERSRIGNTRNVEVEIIVNGLPVATRELEADGSTKAVQFDIDIQQSSWVAARIFPSAHTNPVFIEVAGQPIHASQRSAQWCIEAVDACWDSKVGQIRESERPAARKAYDQAKAFYQQALLQANTP